MARHRVAKKKLAKQHASSALLSYKKVRLPNFVKQNVIALIAMIVSLSTSVVLFYLTYSEPDIRAIPEGYELGVPIDPIKKKGDCFYYGIVGYSFKNLSLKGGYIDKVTFVPVSLDVTPEFNLRLIRASLGG